MTHLEKCYQEHKKKEKIIECTISITATAATGVDTGCFQHRIGIPILGTLIWAYPNLIFSKTETTVKYNSSFLIKSAT